MELPQSVTEKVQDNATLHNMLLIAGPKDRVSALVRLHAEGPPGQSMRERLGVFRKWLSSRHELHDVVDYDGEAAPGLIVAGPAETVVKALSSDSVGSIATDPTHRPSLGVTRPDPGRRDTGWGTPIL